MINKLKNTGKLRKGEIKRLTESLYHFETLTKTPLKDRRLEDFPKLRAKTNLTPNKIPIQALAQGEAVKTKNSFHTLQDPSTMMEDMNVDFQPTEEDSKAINEAISKQGKAQANPVVRSSDHR
ncbi:hypothetical protein JTB14_016981 [Gonioctena quinquepunctata]|nr:hypothetical protein JTB14_016981 [Gonioctena quinquepunctata]